MPFALIISCKSPFPSLKGPWSGADLRLTARTQLHDHGYGASASRGMPVYSLAFAGTH